MDLDEDLENAIFKIPDLTQFFGLEQDDIEYWVSSGFIEASVLTASEEDEAHIFSLSDLFRIRLFQNLLKFKLPLNLIKIILAESCNYFRRNDPHWRDPSRNKEMEKEANENKYLIVIFAPQANEKGLNFMSCLAPDLENTPLTMLGTEVFHGTMIFPLDIIEKDVKAIVSPRLSGP